METCAKALRCRRCGGVDTIVDLKAGDVICRGCGEVQMARLIDNSDETRTFADDDSNKKRESRTSGLPEGCASGETVFQGGSHRVENNYCSSLNRCTFLTESAEDQTQTNLARRIRDISGALNISKRMTNIAEGLARRLTKTTTSSLYSLSSTGCIRKANLQPVSAALVYLACRQDGYGRTLEEIALVSGSDKSAISRMQAAISRDLDLHITRVLPVVLVGRVATQARMTPLVCLYARHVCDMVVKYGLLDSLAPQLVAGCALVLAGLAAREEVDLAKIAAGTLSCTPTQLRRGYERLLTHAAFLLPDEAKLSLGGLGLLPSNLQKFGDGIIPPLPPLGQAEAAAALVAKPKLFSPVQVEVPQASEVKRSVPFNVSLVTLQAALQSSKRARR